MMPITVRASQSIRQVLVDFLNPNGELGRTLGPDWGVHKEWFSDCGFDGVPIWAKVTSETTHDPPYYWCTKEDFCDAVVERWGDEGRALVLETLMEIEQT